MIVVGGCYREICNVPPRDRLFGSGFRAATAISKLSPGSHLYSYAYSGWVTDVELAMKGLGIHPHIRAIEEELVFDYWYPLQRADVPVVRKRSGSIEVEGEVILSFGFLEGDAKVKGKRVVFEPQTTGQKDSFSASKSTAGELVYIVKEEDLANLGQHENPIDAASRVMAEQKAQMVVARTKIGGATLYRGDSAPVVIPAYAAEEWVRIGSGDVFCAAFAHYWGERRKLPQDAADLASRSVAYFNNGDRLPLPDDSELQNLRSIPSSQVRGYVILVGSERTLADKWVFDEAFMWLRHFGADVRLVSDACVVSDTVENECAAILALADHQELRTLCQVGAARAKNIPVILLSEGMSEPDLTMFLGTHCKVVADLTSAVYKAYLATLQMPYDNT